MKKKPVHGGRRKGAGRNPLGETALIKTAITLSQAQIDEAARVGDGNKSAGIRKLIDASAKTRDCILPPG